MRRAIPVASAVAIIAFLALELLLGAAASGTPDEWTVAAPRIGDRGQYEVIHLGPSVEPAVSDLRFERLAPRTAYYPDGTPYAAQVLSESWTQSAGYDALFWQASLDDGTPGGAVHAKVQDKSWSGTVSRAFGVSIHLGGPNNEQDLHVVTTRFDRDYGTCGLRQDLAADPPWFGGCPDGMAPLRTVDWNGTEVLVYGPSQDPERAQVWMHPDYPVPVQVLQRRAAASNETDAAYDVFRLTGFTRGQDPTTPAPPPAAPMPTGTPVEAIEGRPALGGFDVAFGLQEALDGVPGDTLDPQTADVVAFMERPGVYVRAAALHHEIEQDYLLRIWTIHLNDGDSEMEFTVTREDPAEGNPAPFDPVEVAIDGGRYDVDDVESYAYRAPSKQQLPDRLPSVADAAAAWSHAPPEGQENATPDAYAFAHDCAADCNEVDSWVGAGPQTFVSMRSRYGNFAGVSPFPEPNTFSVQGSLRKLSADGSLLRTDEIWQEGHRVSTGVLEPVPSTASSTRPAHAAPTGWSDWAVPSGPVTAAAAGMAGLLGLLVYLGAALRQGPLAALFSRIEAPMLTRHPVRAGIMDAVGAEAGIHFSALTRRLERPPGVVQHHIRKLLDGELLTATTDGHTTSYFVRGQVDHRLAAAAPMLRRAGARAVLEAVQSGSASASAICAETGLGQSTVSHHVKRLRDAGLVAAEKAGRTTRLSITDLGRQASSLAA